jgi:vacuolar-type H+-ATPase subunit C/Vma6
MMIICKLFFVITFLIYLNLFVYRKLLQCVSNDDNIKNNLSENFKCNYKCAYDDSSDYSNYIISSKTQKYTCIDENRQVLSRSKSSSKSRYRNCTKLSPSKNSYSTPKFELIPIEYFERSEECKTAKLDHMDRIDALCSSREDLVMLTTLWNRNVAMEKNMFPCK